MSLGPFAHCAVRTRSSRGAQPGGPTAHTLASRSRASGDSTQDWTARLYKKNGSRQRNIRPPKKPERSTSLLQPASPSPVRCEFPPTPESRSVKQLMLKPGPLLVCPPAGVLTVTPLASSLGVVVRALTLVTAAAGSFPFALGFGCEAEGHTRSDEPFLVATR
eukprot:5584752-Prymnesium_polylepis.1